MRAKSERLLNIATAAVTICAVVLGGHRIYAMTQRADDAVVAEDREPQWREFASGGHRMGPQDAAVTIVEFADFQCPYCRRAAKDLRELRQRYPKDIALIFRHYPLSGHAQATPAAQAAECAGRQGRFEQFHDMLYAEPDSLGHKTWVRFALESGIADSAKFSRCLADDSVQATIAMDRAAGDRLGVEGTPTFLVNDRRIDGYISPRAFERQVQHAIEEARGHTHTWFGF